ncbi:C-C motif chemokine 18-like [Silurus meridionalis]|uniref:C-C motif chemokine 18-like n=1 Tax=Silurus meridionalis TaxID=175797 RepID=UPI001EEADE27|nr:C-C motif chemokine 18-like [Silurus meridionalis]
MFCRSLLLVLLGLSCLQSFTMAEYANGAGLCCFEFHKTPVPAENIVTAEQTRMDCTLPGVILTTKKGLQICADPEVDWVKQIIKIITAE